MSSLPAEADPLNFKERKAEIRAKLKQMYFQDLTTFFLLIRSARVPGFVMKRCIFDVPLCVQEHPSCSDTAPFLGLVKSINDLRHGEIDPEVREIIIESTTQSLIMPGLSFTD